jgi:hypothetical protein
MPRRGKPRRAPHAPAGPGARTVRARPRRGSSLVGVTTTPSGRSRHVLRRQNDRQGHVGRMVQTTNARSLGKVPRTLRQSDRPRRKPNKWLRRHRRLALLVD